MRPLAAYTENLRGQFDVNNALTCTMRGKTDNGRALALAQLACGAAHVVALGGRTYNDNAARWRGCIGRLR